MQLDPEIQQYIESIAPFDINKENVLEHREIAAQLSLPTLYKSNIIKRTIMVPDNDNDRDILVYIYQSSSLSSAPQPALLWMHGGGYVVGNADEERAKLIADKLNITVFSVEYRLAPEHPYPAAIHDCFTVLKYIASNANDLNIDDDRIAIGGHSAGGGLAASLALMNRDKKGPKLVFQLLIYPMIDNLHDTLSGRIPDHYVWNRRNSFNTWEMYFNGNNPGLDASPYAAAARAKDLGNLPAAYVSVGTEDLFRDEAIEYARRLIGDGVACELAVFPGLCHAAELIVPQARVSRRFEESYFRALRDALLCSDGSDSAKS